MSTSAPRRRSSAPLPGADPVAPRVLALDGIRALAVAAVVVYHLDPAFLPGGYLGVDVFFVLSGFLITNLLLGEWEAHGRIVVLAFWRRRARRLVPPLLLAVGAVVVATPVLYGDVAARVRGQAVAGLLLGSNWFEAVAGRSYFDDIGRPPPLRHLWSLGVEAQFYVVWPLLAVAALVVGGRRLLGLVAAAGAAASFAGMALAFAPGVDPSRLYYGTDSRAGTLLVGAALACALPLAGRHRPLAGVGRAVVNLTALGAVAALVMFTLHLDGTSAGAYRGGFLVVALLVAVLLTVAVHPDAGVARVLRARPLVWLGTRSYAVYLWHWPVITATRPDLDVAVHGWALLALRLGSTVALAEATVRLVAVAQRPRPVFAPSIRRRLLFAGSAAGTMLTVAAFAGSTASPAAAPAFFVSPTTTSAPPTTVTTPTTNAAPATTTTAAVPVVTTSTVPATTTTTSQPAIVGPVRVLAVGESVLLGAGGHVQRALGDGTVIDADVARQPEDVLAALDARRAAGHLKGIEVLVVQLGTNGPLRPSHVDGLAELMAGVPQVVAVTVRVPKPWQDASNAALFDAAGRFPWLRLADWHAVSADHPEWFGDDGVHVGREGARQYAAVIAAAVTTP